MPPPSQMKMQCSALPFGVWMVRHAGLKRLADDALATLAERGLVRPEFVRRLLADLLPQHPHYYGTMVWILIMLEHWLRQHAPDWQQPR
jgi:asparagine synthase (glutamine-hydrolysing)